jgi:hypothetical protein
MHIHKQMCLLAASLVAYMLEGVCFLLACMAHQSPAIGHARVIWRFELCTTRSFGECYIR